MAVQRSATAALLLMTMAASVNTADATLCNQGELLAELPKMTPEVQQSCQAAMGPGFNMNTDCLCYKAIDSETKLDLDCRWEEGDHHTLLDRYNECTAPMCNKSVFLAELPKLAPEVQQSCMVAQFEPGFNKDKECLCYKTIVSETKLDLNCYWDEGSIGDHTILDRYNACFPPLCNQGEFLAELPKMTPEVRQSCQAAMGPGFNKDADCLCYKAIDSEIKLDLDCRWEEGDHHTLLDRCNECTATSILATLYRSGFLSVACVGMAVGALATSLAYMYQASRWQIQQPALLA